MPRVLNDVNYVIPDITDNSSVSGVKLRKGQVVQIRRVVTYVYDVDISEWLDASGDPDMQDISVEELVSGETENPYELETSDVEEDIVTRLTILHK